MLGIGIGISPTFSGGWSRYNAAATTYFAAAGITDSTEKNAVSNWANSTQTLRDNGKLIGAYLVSPTSFSSSLYCFERLVQATFTVGNTPNWSALDGWSFNGINHFLISGLNALNDVPTNNGGIAIWNLDDAGSTGVTVGANTASTNQFIFNVENGSNQVVFGAYNNATILTGTAGSSNDFMAGYVVSAASRKLYKAQAEIGTSSSVTSTPPNLVIYMGCSNSSGTAANFQLRRLASIFITQGLTASEHNTLESATRIYLQSIGRI